MTNAWVQGLQGLVDGAGCDYALVIDSEGVLTVHRADCPDVRTAAAAGLPVATMLGCAKAPDGKLPRHTCLRMN
jgi:hypothetical protein